MRLNKNCFLLGALGLLGFVPVQAQDEPATRSDARTQAAASAAQDQAAASADQQAPDEAEDVEPLGAIEERICTEDLPTGSRISSRRICLTQSEWDEIHGSTRNAVNEVQSRAAGGYIYPN